jgi:hypothetical protein
MTNKIQEVVLPYIQQTDKDHSKDPQFIRKRANNQAVIYVNDFSFVNSSNLINAQISLNGQVILENIKRLYVSKVVLYESDFVNINNGNNVISITLPSIDATVYTVTFPVTRITNTTSLRAYLQAMFATVSPALPGGLNAVTITFSVATYSDESIDITVTGIGTNVGVTLQWVTTTSVFVYGDAMWGWSPTTSSTSSLIGSDFFLRPKFLPCYYLDICSKVLTSRSKNINRSTSLTANDIVYRYYFNPVNKSINWNTSSTYRYNWDKASITYFDIRIQDDFSRTNVGYVTDAGTSITMEITA